MNNLFKGKIKCEICGKNYNFKLDHNIPVYICSGYKNYGSNFCPRNQILQKDLINIVQKHLELQGRVNVPINDLNQSVVKITANLCSLLIEYDDDSTSEWNYEKIKF